MAAIWFLDDLLLTGQAAELKEVRKERLRGIRYSRLGRVSGETPAAVLIECSTASGLQVGRERQSRAGCSAPRVIFASLQTY